MLQRLQMPQAAATLQAALAQLVQLALRRLQALQVLRPCSLPRLPLQHFTHHLCICLL